MRVERIGNAVLYLGDAREIYPSIAGPGVVIVDPPWDQATNIAGADDPRGLFAQLAPHMAKHKTVAVQLGCYTDPCFLTPVAARMPFLHTCWLRYVPPSYRGRVLVDADLAYVYGVAPKSAPGRRVIPSMTQSTRRAPSEKDFIKSHGRNRTSSVAKATIEAAPHPMPRCLSHVRWLVDWHAEQDDVIVDPLMGSGTTGVAAVESGRSFVGIETCSDFFSYACERIDNAYRQQRMFA